MSLIKNWDLSTGDLSQITGGWEYVGATTGGVPPLSSRVQVVTNLEGITAPGGGYYMRIEVRQGDKYGGSAGERVLFRPDNGSGPYGLALRQPGYDSTTVWTQNMPTGWPNGANVWVAGREWHHLGGEVAPSHFIAYANEFRVDVYGGNATSKTTYVNQTILSGYAKNAWYIFCERYRHGLAPNGHYELWAARVGVDSSMTQLIVAPGIGTTYSNSYVVNGVTYTGLYQLFGHYRETQATTTFFRLSKGKEFSSLNEGLAYATSFLTGTPPAPDPPPGPPPTATLPTNTRDRRVGVTVIGSQRNSLAADTKAAIKVPTGLAPGESGLAHELHIAIEGGAVASGSATCPTTLGLYADDDGDGFPDTYLGEADTQMLPQAAQAMQWMTCTSAAGIAFDGENVWLAETTDGPTARCIYAVDTATNGLVGNGSTYGASAPRFPSSFGASTFYNLRMSACFDYDVVAGTPTPPGDTDIPVLSTASVISNNVLIDYNEPLDVTSVPATGDFAVKVNTTPVTKTGVAVAGSRVTVTLTAPVLDTDTVTVSYTPGTNKIQDIAGNDAATLTDHAVTNNTPDVSEPAISLPPQRVDDDSYLLRGTVNPNGVASVAYFQYGPTTAYELGDTAPQAVGSGTQPVAVEQRVDDLELDQTYHYRIVRDDA